VSRGDVVAGFLTDRVYAGEWAIACPACGFEYSHVREAGTLLGGDEGGVYPGTRAIGLAPDHERRSAVAIVFDGECGHAWALRIQQHKGINFVTVGLMASREPEE
jgi:hypothetical protein